MCWSPQAPSKDRDHDDQRDLDLDHVFCHNQANERKHGTAKSCQSRLCGAVPESRIPVRLFLRALVGANHCQEKADYPQILKVKEERRSVPRHGSRGRVNPFDVLVSRSRARPRKAVSLSGNSAAERTQRGQVPSTFGLFGIEER
jgi:hypothetical protein